MMPQAMFAALGLLFTFRQADLEQTVYARQAVG
jgi:hypothetical protein